MIYELFQDTTYGLFVQLRKTISADTPRDEQIRLNAFNLKNCMSGFGEYLKNVRLFSGLY